jgi:hypothetical protein
MDEAQATPALLKIISQTNHLERETALLILMSQATPESLRALRQIDPQGFSRKARQRLNTALNNPQLCSRARNRNLAGKNFCAPSENNAGRCRRLLALVEKVPDGEKDVVAVLKQDDLPLVRKVRRRMIANANPHATDFIIPSQAF